MRRTIIALAASVLLCPAALAGGDEPEHIDFTRPFHPGQSFEVLGHGSQRRSLVDNDGANVVPEFEQSIDFNAEMTVGRVDAEGRPTHAIYRIVTCALQTAEGPVELAPTGAKLTAVRDGATTTFTLDTRPVPPQHGRLLELVAGLGTGGPTDEAIFGSDRPRRVGESWPVNTGAAATMLELAFGLPVRAENVWGVTEFAGHADHEERSCLVLRSRVTVDEHDVIRPEGVPAIAKQVSGALSLRRQVLLADETRAPAASDSTRLTRQARFESDGGMGMELTEKWVIQRAMLPIAAPPVQSTAQAEAPL